MNTSPNEESHQPVDESMKALLRNHPGVLFRLTGAGVEPHRVRMEDTAINVPEQRADHVFMLDHEQGEPTGGV